MIFFARFLAWTVFVFATMLAADFIEFPSNIKVTPLAAYALSIWMYMVTIGGQLDKMNEDKEN